MNQKERQFIRAVEAFYTAHGRHGLPWRKTTNPYRILVSEIMLQQTQVDRVRPKYQAFLKRWPQVKDLAAASLGDVLREWQGLGYNRRAKLLHAAAQSVVTDYGGRFPKTYEGLLALPGVGPYTAGAVMAFAYNQPVPILETNIRTVYIHHFYKNRGDVSEAEMLAKVKKTLPADDVRAWYAALMDYGTHLKKEVGNLNTKAKAYQKQSTFAGSDRQIRGAIIRELGNGRMTMATLKKRLDFDSARLKEQLEKLQAEQLIAKVGRSYMLPQ